jgi:hypothetical protein
MREGTASMAIAVGRPYGGICDFYSVSPEYVRLTLECDNDKKDALK